MKDKRFTLHTRTGKLEVNVTTLETEEAAPSYYQWGFKRVDSSTHKRNKRTKRGFFGRHKTRKYM